MASTEPDATLMMRYCDEVLLPMLTEGCGVDTALAAVISADVLTRARLFAALPDCVRDVLMTPFIEEVFDHDPPEVALEMKAAVTVVVRNSLLEEAHADGPLKSGGIRVITTAACAPLSHVLAAGRRGRVCPDGDNLFAQSQPTVRAGPRPRDCARESLPRPPLQRWQQIHALIEAGVGLLDCSRRLGLALNTVKRYARAATPERIQRVPKFRACMVDPYRDHLRARREQEPGVGATALLGEIRALGYNGSQNLLVRYLNQGRHLDECPLLSPRRAARLLLTRPENLTERQRERLDALAAACPEMAALAAAVRSFATLLAPHKDNPTRLAAWTTATREADLPHVHSFARGINQDIDAVTAAITLDHHNGRTEGVNTKTKLLKLADVRTSRHGSPAPPHPPRITPPPKVRQSR